MGAFLAGVAFELLVLAATGSALSETRVARLRWRAGLLAIISAISTLLLIYGCRGLFLAWQWRNAFDSLPPGSTPIRWYMYPPTWSDIRWMVAELSAVAVVTLASAWGAWRVWKMAIPLPAGLCRACSYNLMGNASGVCPECGTRIDHLE